MLRNPCGYTRQSCSAGSNTLSDQVWSECGVPYNAVCPKKGCVLAQDETINRANICNTLITY